MLLPLSALVITSPYKTSAFSPPPREIVLDLRERLPHPPPCICHANMYPLLHELLLNLSVIRTPSPRPPVFYNILVAADLVAGVNHSLNQDREELMGFPELAVPEIKVFQDPDGKYYLDNRLGNVSNDDIEKNYTAIEKDLGYTVYARVTDQTYKSKMYIIIQYWMFYAFNKGPLNTHEGDWEMVQLVLDSNQNPREAMYSQHISGERAEWDLLESDGEHMKVYIARGSHANYFRSYQGKLSLSNDVVCSDGKTLEPEDYTLVQLGEKGLGDHTPDQDWLEFAGRWGEWGGAQDELRGKRGSYGPVYREEGEMWDTPMDWGKDLNSVNENTFRLNWFFYNFFEIFIVLAFIGFLIRLLRIRKSYKETGLGKRIFSILYIDGPNLKSIGNLLTIVGVALAVASLFHPWYSISVDVDSGDFKTDGMVEVVHISGEDGVLINTLESNSGMIQVFSFPLPFSYIIGLGLLFLLMGTIGVQKSTALGRKYLIAGIKLALPIAIILIFVAQAANLVGMAPIDLDQESEDLVDTVSSSPWEGNDTAVVGEYGSAEVEWGIEQGGWYLLGAGALLFLAGIMEIISSKDLYGPDPKHEKSIQEIRQKIQGLERELDQKKDERDQKTMDKKREKDLKDFGMIHHKDPNLMAAGMGIGVGMGGHQNKNVVDSELGPDQNLMNKGMGVIGGTDQKNAPMTEQQDQANLAMNPQQDKNPVSNEKQQDQNVTDKKFEANDFLK